MTNRSPAARSLSKSPPPHDKLGETTQQTRCFCQRNLQSHRHCIATTTRKEREAFAATLLTLLLREYDRTAASEMLTTRRAGLNGNIAQRSSCFVIARLLHVVAKPLPTMALECWQVCVCVCVLMGVAYVVLCKCLFKSIEPLACVSDGDRGARCDGIRCDSMWLDCAAKYALCCVAVVDLRCVFVLQECLKIHGKK